MDFKKIEWNDLRCILTLLNVTLVIFCGQTFAWIGVAIAALGICKDIFTDKKINGLVMHLAGLFLNLYILMH